MPSIALVIALSAAADPGRSGIVNRSALRARVGLYVAEVTFANVGTLGVHPGQREALVSILTRRSAELADIGCLLYEVGVNDDQPDTVFVAELWTSADAHRASLQLESVQQQIAEARPLLTGEMGGFQFDVLGSPLGHKSQLGDDGSS